MSLTTRNCAQTQKTIQKANEKTKDQKENSIANNITFITKKVKKSLAKNKKADTTEGMDINNKNTNTVASSASTSESFSSNTMPQKISLTFSLEKEKDKELTPMNAVITLIITITQPEEIIDDTVYEKIMQRTSF